jgi:hypothetical protein
LSSCGGDWFELLLLFVVDALFGRCLARDKGCIFTGATSNSDTLVATWIFPPFLGYTVSTNNAYAATAYSSYHVVVVWQLSDDPWLDRTYIDTPDACDLSEFMVVTNTVSGRRDVVVLFYENKLGIDVDVWYSRDSDHFAFLILVQDNYRIVIFDGSMLKDAKSVKSHITFDDGQDRPSDRYLHLHFQRCLTVSACGGNPTEDYEDQEIDLFMEELGVYDDEMDTTDPRWMTPLGVEVYAYLIRQKMAE